MTDLWNLDETYSGSGLHVMQALGSIVAANVGISSCILKPSRQKSENTKDAYVEDSVESGLEVFQSASL